MPTSKQVDSSTVDAALSRFGLRGPATFLGHSRNHVFAVESGQQQFILRLTSDASESFDDVESELDWTIHLKRHAVTIANPCSSRSGRLVEWLETSGGGYSACVFERAPGRELRFHEDANDWDRGIHRQLGALLGKLHRATSCYNPSPGVVRRRRWDGETVFHLHQAAGVLPESDRELQAEFRDVWAWLEALPEDSANFGLTHNDAHRGNFFYDGEQITMFDTSSAFYCWFAYDLAQPLYYSGPVFFGDRAATPEMLVELKEDLVAGYRQEFPISDEWAKRIDGFVRLRRLQMHSFMYRQYGGPLSDTWFVRNREAMRSKEPLV